MQFIYKHIYSKKILYLIYKYIYSKTYDNPVSKSKYL